MSREITKKILYKRQTTLKEVGEKGQEKLQNAKVLVIGCGGLGCVAAVYLAASGIGNIGLIDFDVVDESNLHRQVFYKISDIGKSKAAVLANYIEQISPFVTVNFSENAISKQNIFNQLKDYDIVLDCTDSLPIKYLINDACVLKDKVLVYGSLYKFDGYVATFNTLINEQRTCNLRDAFPEIPKKSVPNCSEIGTLNTIVGMIGLLQANEVLKLVTETGELITNQLLIYNSLKNFQYKMTLKKRFSSKMILEKFNKENYKAIACEIQDKKLLISAKTLKGKLNKVELISVIENQETKLPFDVQHKIPLSKLNVTTFAIQVEKEYVIICNKGISSYEATKLFKEKYPNLNILSLEGGISEYENL